MNDSVICKKNICFLLYTAITTFFLAMGHILSSIHRFATGFLLVIVAVALYFIIVFLVAEKNWLDIRAIFHAVWVATIGLASLRLTDYQEKWQAETWYCVALAYLIFQIGAQSGVAFGKSLFDNVKNIVKKVKLGKIRFEVKENRFFWICVITTLIGLACFVCNVIIRGYIPCFSNDPAAYVTFYTRFHIFAVAATGVSGLCYYTIVTQKLNKIKKFILLLCILYATFLFPIFVVSRGTFIASALSLTVTVFYLHKKKFWVLVLCLTVIISVYFGASILRNYTDAQLEYFFEPSQIHVDSSKNPNSSSSSLSSSEESSSSSSSNTDNEDQNENNDNTSSGFVFTLPPKLTFVYSYLTVSHDNFNEAVQNSTEYTYGLHQISPFNSILRSNWIEDKLSESEYYLVRPHLNTVNLIGYFYYDFHIWGVIIFTLLWAFIFGVLQKFAEIAKKPFFLLALGNAMVPVALCFFSAWLSVFSQWMLWGVVLIFAVASSIKIESKKKFDNN